MNEQMIALQRENIELKGIIETLAKGIYTDNIKSLIHLGESLHTKECELSLMQEELIETENKLEIAHTLLTDVYMCNDNIRTSIIGEIIKVVLLEGLQ